MALLSSSTDAGPLKCLRVLWGGAQHAAGDPRQELWAKRSALERLMGKRSEERRQAGRWFEEAKREDTEERKRGSRERHEPKVGQASTANHLLTESPLTLSPLTPCFFHHNVHAWDKITSGEIPVTDRVTPLQFRSVIQSIGLVIACKGIGSKGERGSRGRYRYIYNCD